MKIINSLRIILLSAVVYLSISIGVADEPSPERGGPVLTIQNDTDFTLTFPHIDTLRCYLSTLSTGSRFYPEPVSPHTSPELRFNWGGFEYWFGTAGQINDELTIKSPEWPYDAAIVVKLKKVKNGASEFVKKEYKYAITPCLKKDRENGKAMTPSIDWTLTWNGNGWKMTLKQSEIDTGVIHD